MMSKYVQSIAVASIVAGGGGCGGGGSGVPPKYNNLKKNVGKD